MKNFLVVIAAGAASGVLLALALPPIGVGWLGPICIAPLLAAASGRGLLKGFVGGITVPIAAVMVVQAGIFHRVPHDEGMTSWLYTAFGFFGFVVALVSCVASESKLSGWRRIVTLAAVGVVLEFALFPILPAHLALTQYRQPGMLVLASAGGIWIVSFLVWAANAAFAEGIRKASYRPALIMAACLAVVYGLGFAQPRTAGPLTRVGAVQTQATDLASLRKWNAVCGRAGAEVVVWPEFSGLEVVPHGDTVDLRTLSTEPGQPPFVTTFRDDFEPLPHNVAALFEAGKESERYFKRKVFGGESKMHAPGVEPKAIAWAGHPRLGLAICFDSCYPRMMSETASLGVGLIALPTIDPNATDCFVAAAHSAFTPFRAAENGVAIVRADGIAYSQIVDDTGRLVAELGPNLEGIITGDVSTSRRWTLYSVLGDWVLYLCGIYVLVTLFTSVKRRARTANPKL